MLIPGKKTMAMPDWGKLFEPFYGKDYCLRVTMDLEMLRDEQYLGNSFRFEEGWVRPTLDLLQRLRNQGFPVRTNDCILVHLTCPLESMAYGEFYLQVGRKLPGRLSLKFTRRQPDGTHVIQPTTLKPEEEQLIAADPCRYLAELREKARKTQPDHQRMLTVLVLMNSQCARVRVDAVSFFQSLIESNNNRLQFNHHPPTRPIVTTPDSVFSPTYPPEALCSFPTSTPSPVMLNVGYRQARSGSEGLIPRLPANNGNLIIRPIAPVRHTGPVENDETSQISSSSSEGAAGAQPSAQVPNKEPPRLYEPLPGKPGEATLSRSSPRNPAALGRPMSTGDYVATDHGLTGQCDQQNGRRESNDSSSGRTSLQSDYAMVTNAFASLNFSNSTASDDPETPPIAGVTPNTLQVPVRRPSQQEASLNGCLLPNVSLLHGSARNPNVTAWLQSCPSLPSVDVRERAMIQEDYTGTVQALEGASYDPSSWTSHQQHDSHAVYGFYQGVPGQFYTVNPNSLMYPSVSGQQPLIPLSVEEMNRLPEEHQWQRVENQK